VSNLGDVESGRRLPGLLKFDIAPDSRVTGRSTAGRWRGNMFGAQVRVVVIYGEMRKAVVSWWEIVG
jgi:hypothetical protein